MRKLENLSVWGRKAREFMHDYNMQLCIADKWYIFIFNETIGVLLVYDDEVVVDYHFIYYRSLH